MTWFLPSSLAMSQILVVPSSEKVANIELSSGAQILYRGVGERGREGRMVGREGRVSECERWEGERGRDGKMDGGREG